MFLHNYIYRLKCIVRDKEMLFWTLLFPIILATLFNMTISNLSNTEKFLEIKIAVINNEEYEKNTPFQEAIKAVSNTDSSTEKNLFDVKYTSKEQGNKLLENNEIEGYIYFDNGMKLVVKESGLNETIIKSFIDDFIQTSSTVETIIKKDPGAIQRGILTDISNRDDYLREVPASKSAPDVTVNYFYTIIAMTCLYGSFFGFKEVTAIQADLSYQGARVNIAPTHKLKVFIVAIFAAATVQLFGIFILLVYLVFILNIDFGGQIGYITLTCITGTITGITFGTFITSVVKGGEGIKMGVLIGSTMLMVFLSGMMYHEIKYIIITNIPIIGYINPANLIADSFYSLYYYDTYARFFTNITMLWGLIIAFSLGTYFILRRQKYASL